MSDELAKAMATPVGTLPPFEGRDVIRAAVEMPNAAGGLRDAMEFEPRTLHHREEGYIVVHFSVRKVRFDPIKDTEGLARVHVLDVDEAAFIDGDVVESALAAQRERISALRDAADRQREAGDGIARMPYTEELQGDHAAGLHTDLVEGCPECDQERDAE